MDSSDPQFVGTPCGSHGPYTFYKGVRFQWNNKTHILKLGDFFFLKILDNFPGCIGEIQLLWDEKNCENQQLASVKLYFKPKDSAVLVGPDKTEEPLDGFGHDELLVMADKLIVTIEDLVARILPASTQEEWAYGTPISDHHDVPVAEGYIPEGNSELSAFANPNGMQPMNFEEIEKEKKFCGILGKNNDLIAPVVIMSYPVYCRFRAMMRRLEGTSDAFFNSILVMAIGGFTMLKAGMRVMYCRQEFEFSDLEDLEIHREDLTPNLKGRPRKRKMKRDDSDSNGYESSDQSCSTSSSAPKVKSQRLQERLDSRNGIHGSENSGDDEKTFLKKLYKFMASKNSPIDRLPVLGCKKIDLFALYQAAKELGGYKKICDNRLWKNLYDRLGGQSSNTSAATSTRRHYERLILPYENFLRATERANRARGRAEAASRDTHVNGQFKEKVSFMQRILPAIPLGVTEHKMVVDEKKSDSANKNGTVNTANKVGTADVSDKISTVDTEPESVRTDTDSVHIAAQEKATAVKNETADGEDSKKTCTTSTGTGPEPPKGTSPSKAVKTEDPVHKKPAFPHHVPPLEVPVYRHHRDSTSILSPMMQRKHGHPHPYPYHYPMAQQADIANHNTHHKSHHLSQVGNHRRHGPVHPTNHHGHNSHHKSSPSSHKSSGSTHKALPASPTVRQQWQRREARNSFSDPVRDPHVLASQDSSEMPMKHPLIAAHIQSIRYPTTDIPPLPPGHAHLRRQRVHTDIHTSLDNTSFPRPDQVLSRIHTQQAQLLSAHQIHTAKPRSKITVANSNTTSSVRSTASSSAGAQNLHSELFAGVPSFRDPGKRGRPGPQPGTSSSSSARPSTSTSAASMAGIQGSSKNSAAQQAAAEAIQQAHEQQEVLLQSALFGSQFTALPRPAKPSDALSSSAVSAFLPSLVHHHPAFVQAALMNPGLMPPTSAASTLAVFPPSLLAYSEEMQRQLAAVSLSPFMQLGSFTQPPAAKDSSSQQK